MPRPRFTLRTLLVVVALAGIGLYFRPGQVHPRDAPKGASKAWVEWNCGDTTSKIGDDLWIYNNVDVFDDYVVEFDDNGQLLETTFMPKRRDYKFIAP